METFNAYQEFTESLAKYNTEVEMYSTGTMWNLPYLYPLLALAEETGEVCGKVAKFVRKSLENPNVDVVQLREDVKLELGDLQYQLSETARKFDWTLQEIVDGNVAKLSDRAERGVIVGEGDNR